jgi:TonB family protein
MRNPVFLLALLVAAGATAWAQQELPPTTDQGPNTIKPAAQTQVPGESGAEPAAPVPDKDGVYLVVDGITPPVLTNAVPATYPPGTNEESQPHNCLLSVVIGADGAPSKVELVNPHGSPYDEFAIAAVQQSKFQPATLDGKPVPVLVRVRVPFFHLNPAIPKLLLHVPHPCSFMLNGNDPRRMASGIIPPKAIVNAVPEYSDPARKQKIQGAVIVSMLVTEEGLPTDFRIEKSLGYGLDEKALQCAAKYRFQPATRDGNPVADRIVVEMNFRLY